MKESIPSTYDHEFFQRYHAKWEALMDKFLSGGKIEEIDIFANKGRELKSRYPNVESFAFWHLLGGSSIYDDKTILETDFPGEDSIALFLDNLIEKYVPEYKTD